MYKDVPIANMPNKVRVIEYQNENVIVLLKQKFKKGSFYCPFFLSELKICSEVFRKFLRGF